MPNRILVGLAIAAGLMNPVAALVAVGEHIKNAEPVMLALFAVPWLIGAFLVQRGRSTTGAIVVGALALLDLAAAPTWHRTTALDWSTQAVAVGLAAACLTLLSAVLARRYRGARRTAAVR